MTQRGSLPVRWAAGALIAAAMLFVQGCVNTTVVRANADPAIKASEEIPENQLLDVGIEIFDPNVPEDIEELEEDNIFPAVRKAEARYFPFLLKNTLQGTGHWGAVRVMPRDNQSVDLLVRGKILHSDGESMAVEVVAQDATGRVWLAAEYEDLASKFHYREGELEPQDPFQGLYNAVANDLVAVREQLSSRDLQRIRQVAELRFAASLSPEVFSDYLSESEDGRLDVRRLPAYSDPMVARMQRIREREYLFIDTLDGHYTDFHDDMSEAYVQWRKYTYEEVLALREMQRQARLRKLLGVAAVVGAIAMDRNSESSMGRVASQSLLLGGITAFKSGMDLKSQSKIHAEVLRELGGSFNAEVEPLVVDIEGQTVTLSGSVDAQFDEWRRLLREIYATEAGLPIEPEPIETADGERDTVAEF